MLQHKQAMLRPTQVRPLIMQAMQQRIQTMLPIMFGLGINAASTVNGINQFKHANSNGSNNAALNVSTATQTGTNASSY